MTTAPHKSATDRECSSADFPKGMLATLWAFGGGRERGCANQPPWWANAFTAIAFAALAGVTAYAITPDQQTIFYGLVGAGAAALWHATATALNPTNYHGVCATCGLCSVHDGVKPARTIKKCNENLAASGWVVSLDGKREHCPIHLGFY